MGNQIQPILDWNKNQNLGGWQIQAMGILLHPNLHRRNWPTCVSSLYFLYFTSLNKNSPTIYLVTDVFNFETGTKHWRAVSYTSGSQTEWHGCFKHSEECISRSTDQHSNVRQRNLFTHRYKYFSQIPSVIICVCIHQQNHENRENVSNHAEEDRAWFYEYFS